MRTTMPIVACHHCQTLNRVPAERAEQNPVCAQCKQLLLPDHPIELTDANFERVITKTELPVLVDFWATWCGPCQGMAPHFARVAAQLKGQALLAKLDTDANPHTAARFGIRSIPTLILFRDGQELKRQAGAMQAGQILQWLAT
ncbi:MAG: thioredoxin TrxC [Rhodocyclaceae bacterium]